MRAKIDVIPPIPPQVGGSYGQFGFYKFGVCCWQYDGYDGEVEFVNTQHFCTEPKYPGPTAFRYWFALNVIANVQIIPTVRTDVNPFNVNGKTINPATGDGMPLMITG